MSSVMDKLGKARWWAANVTLYPERYDQTAAMLVDVIRAVEELATERQDKPASTSVGNGALPTAFELPGIGDVLAEWERFEGITVGLRARTVLDMVRARVMPEFARRDREVERLQGVVYHQNKMLEDGVSRCVHEARLTDLRADVMSRDKRITELEKQLATLNNWASICGGQTPTVDGKTPEQVFMSVYEALFLDALDAIILKRRIDSDEILYEEREGARDSAMEAGIQAVLRVFGPALAKQAVADALGRVRERIETDGLRIFEGERHGIDAIGCAVAMIDAELSALEAPKPTSDHVHELGSCSFCDKRPPDTSTESGLPDAVLWAMGAPTTQARAVEMVGAVRDLARRTHGALAERAEPSPK